MPLFSIDVEARIAQATDAVNRLTHQVEGNAKRMDAAFRGVKNTLGAIGVGLSVRGFAQFIKGAIDAADHLNDLSKSTGVAVETLGGIGFAAQQAGTNLEGVAKAFGKMNINVAAAAAGNEEAAQAFNVMNVSLRDAGGRIKQADQVFKELADRFASYEDGPNKAALANKIFGKSYQDILPLLDEGGDKLLEQEAFFKKYGGTTKDVAERADQFNDTLTAIQLVIKGVGAQLASELLPTLQSLADYLLQAKDNGGLFLQMAQGFTEIFKGIILTGAGVVATFKTIGQSVGATAAIIEALSNREFARAAEISKQLGADVLKTAKDLNALHQRITNPEKEVVQATTATERAQGRKRPAPGLPDKASGDAAGALLKKQLEQNLKILELAIARESDLLHSRNEAFEQYYQADYLTVKEFYRLNAEAQSIALAEERLAFDKEEAALKKYIANRQAALGKVKGGAATPTGAKIQEDIISAEEKLADVIAKRGKTEQEAAEKGTKAWFDETRALTAYEKKIVEMQVTLAEANDDFEKAARLRASLIKTQTGEDLGSKPTAQDQATVDAINQRAGALAQVNAEQQKGDVLYRDLANTERRIQAQRIAGQITEEEAIQRTDAARQQQVAKLNQVADAMERVAIASGDKAALRNVEEMRTQIAELAAVADEAGNRMRAVFEDSLVDPLMDFVNHTKSAKDAFLDFAKNIEQALLRIATRNIAESLFKTGGSDGTGAGAFAGAAGWFANLFKGSGGGGATTSTATSAGSAVVFSAMGNVMTSHGPLRLQRYSAGGIATRPQLAMFGEGRTPEAYVPLPDGRSIPVSMKGTQRAVTQQNISFNVSTPDAASFRRSEGQIMTSLAIGARRAINRR